MTLKRYGLGREYAGNTGSPAITEQPHGAYVRHDDYLALADELRAEKAGLERIIMAQEVALTELREGMEAIGAGGVSPLMGDRYAPHWYAVDNAGMATLCVDEQDARESAIEFAETWPNRSPYFVGRIMAVDVGKP